MDQNEFCDKFFFKWMEWVGEWPFFVIWPTHVKMS